MAGIAAVVRLGLRRGSDERDEEVSRGEQEAGDDALAELIADSGDATMRAGEAIPGSERDTLVERTLAVRPVVAEALDNDDSASVQPFMDEGAWLRVASWRRPPLPLDDGTPHTVSIRAATVHADIARVVVRIELVDEAGRPTEDWVWERSIASPPLQRTACHACATVLDGATRCPACAASRIPAPGEWRIVNVTLLRGIAGETVMYGCSALVDAALGAGESALGTVPVGVGAGAPRSAAADIATIRDTDTEFDSQLFLARVSRTIAAVYAEWRTPGTSFLLADYATSDFVAALAAAVASRPAGMPGADFADPAINALRPHVAAAAQGDTVLAVVVEGEDDRLYRERWYFVRRSGAPALQMAGLTCRDCGAPRDLTRTGACRWCGHSADGDREPFRLAAIAMT